MSARFENYILANAWTELWSEYIFGLNISKKRNTMLVIEKVKSRQSWFA